MVAMLTWPAVATAKTSADKLIRAHGVGGDRACLAFIGPEAVEYRKDRWRRAIDELYEQHPEFVLQWIVGATEPPRAAIEEAAKQRDCLIDLIVHDAASAQTRLILDYQKEDGTKAGMAAMKERYRASRAFRSAVLALSDTIRYATMSPTTPSADMTTRML